MITVLVLAVVATAADAAPFRFPGQISKLRVHPAPVGYGPPRTKGYGPPPSKSYDPPPSKVYGPPPTKSYGPPPEPEDEISLWLRLVGPLTAAPSNHLDDRPGPSIYDDYRPPAHSQAAASRPLWFDEFPHRRAVLNWQHKRVQQGLPTYKLLSQRPGFPFYQGN